MPKSTFNKTKVFRFKFSRVIIDCLQIIHIPVGFGEYGVCCSHYDWCMLRQKEKTEGYETEGQMYPSIGLCSAGLFRSTIKQSNKIRTCQKSISILPSCLHLSFSMLVNSGLLENTNKDYCNKSAS